jgi:ferredoxin
MAYVIGEPCIGVKDASCAAICPVNCISEGALTYVINRGACVDCGACVAVCPVSAITHEDMQPDEFRLRGD